MPQARLTDAAAKKAGPGLHWDTHKDAPRGFLLRVTAAGSRSWCLNYRTRDSGRERRLTIGDMASWPIELARKKAADLRRVIDEGGDPLGELEERRDAPSVSDLAKRFDEEAMPNRAPGTQEEYRALLRDWILPAIGRLKVAEVDREDIERLHRKVSATGKLRRANAVKGLCSVLFNQAVIWKMRSDNPARGVKGNPEPGRERYLTGEEIERLLDVLDGWRDRNADTADVIALAMLTGARRGEILGMAWSQIDLDAAVWTKPASTTKQRKLHRVPLSPEAVTVLRRRHEERAAASEKIVRLRTDDRVFAQLNEHTLEFHWVQIRAAAGIADVRFHDLRHSFASWLVGQGLSLPIIGQLLGHSKAATTERYAHLADQPLRAATALVGKLIGGGKGGSAK